MRLVSRYRRMELGLVGFNASNKTTPRANLMSAVTPIADIAIYSITASARARTARWYCEAQCLGGFKIDHQIVLGRRLHRQGVKRTVAPTCRNVR